MLCFIRFQDSRCNLKLREAQEGMIMFKSFIALSWLLHDKAIDLNHNLVNVHLFVVSSN